MKFPVSNRSRRPRLTGALLAAALLGLAACETEIAPPFEVVGTGVVEGRLFFDADGDGLFDPLAGDEPLAGVQLGVYRRGTAELFAGAQTTTGAEGRFRVQGLPIGTHDVFVNAATLPEGVVCQNPVPASVYRDEPTYVDVTVRIACRISIEEAKAAAQGTVVNVRGIVTMRPGQSRLQGDDMYVQDATGGIKIFGSAIGGHDLEIGDLVDITATLGAFNDELQLTSPQINEVVEDVGAPAPAPVTTNEAALQGAPLTAPLLGRLVRVEGAVLLTPFASGGGRNARIDDGSGAVEVRIEPGVIESTDDINPRFTVGACYNITGVLGSFRGTAQIKPRQLTDMEEVPCN